MRKGLTELVFILDRSGSMSGLEKDTIGGFNSMIERQKQKDGEAYVTTVLFDNDLKTVHDRKKLSDVEKMTEKDYFVGGCTALLDAIGETVTHIGNIHKYARHEDVPENTVFVITTDGMENASQKYDAESVRQIVERQQKKYGWEFIFLGANIDAIKTAGNIGIRADRAANYKCDGYGTSLNFTAMSNAIERIRDRRPMDASWKEEIENDFKNR